MGLDHQGIHVDMLIQKYVWNVLFKKREEWLNIQSSRGGGLGGLYFRWWENVPFQHFAHCSISFVFDKYYLIMI